MTTISQNGEDYFKSLRLIHLALIAGQVFFIATVFALQYTGGFGFGADADFETIFSLVVFALTIGGYLASRFFVDARMAKLVHESSLPLKMEQYRANMIMRWAFLEAPSFAAIIGFMLFGQWMFLLVSVLLIGLTAIASSSRASAENTLQLSTEEIARLDDPAEIIAGSSTR